MSSSVIKLNGLTKKYGNFLAVDHLDLSIEKGEVFGLLGPNGAGKSTTILMMLGLSEPTAGTATVCGLNSTTNPIEVKRKVGYLPDDIGFYENYSGFENLLYTAALNGLTRTEAKKRANELLKLVGLLTEAHKKAGKYSRGMRQRLGLADVLIKNPEVIILDEPTLGIDPQGVKEFLDLIVQLSKAQGITVLLSSHHLHQVQQVCDRVGIFVNGKLLAEGDVGKLSRQLFPEELMNITIRVGGANSSRDRQVIQQLLENLNGVQQVQFSDGLFSVSCTQDVTAVVAREIVMKGYDLLHLYPKIYGLDEIYHRYFEGGKL